MRWRSRRAHVRFFSGAMAQSNPWLDAFQRGANRTLNGLVERLRPDLFNLPVLPFYKGEKSVCIGLLLVFVLVYSVLLVGGVVSAFMAPKPRQGEAIGFFISLSSPYVWLPCLLTFIAGSLWAYRRLHNQASANR